MTTTTLAPAMCCAPQRSTDGGLDHIPLPCSPGALWLCAKRVVAPDPEAALKRAGGASVIVAFTELSELETEYPGYVEWLGHHDGGAALWFPVPDFHAPSFDDAVPMVRTIIEHLNADRGLVLHCAGGIGRAPTIAVCVLVALGMSAQEALAHVATHRPNAGPEVEAQHQLVRAFAERGAMGS